jgi:DNA polymerase I-like protein with 3'-5' exonuclease and polymerase domains/uracil-DNA glycosylase
MGFFFDDAPASGQPADSGQQRAPARPKRGQGGKEKEFNPQGPRGCAACPLQARWGVISSPVMKIKGPRDARFLILGHVPSEEADKRNQPFAEADGQWLRKLLPGRVMGEVAFQYAVRCYTPRPAKHTDAFAPPQANHACSELLEADLADYKDIEFIIGIGQLPLSRIFPGASIGRVHGTRIPIRLAGRVLWYYPIIDPEYVSRMGGDRSPPAAVVKADLKRFFKRCNTWAKPRIAHMDPKDVLVAHSREQAEKLIRSLKGPLGFDIETNELRPNVRDSAIWTAAFSDCETTVAFSVDHPGGPNDWGMDVMLETCRRRKWIAHNAAFELLWITHFARARGESDAFAEFDDSQAYGRLYHERETIQSLEDLSLVHLGINLKALTGITGKTMKNYPLQDVLPYNGLDALGSVLLVREMAGKVDATNYRRLLEGIRATVEMELRGLPVDLKRAAELEAEWGAKERAARAEARTIYEARQWEAVTQRPFNISSPDDLGEALVTYGKLKLPLAPGNREGGKVRYVTDDAALQAAVKERPSPLVDIVLRVREASKMKSTYIDPIIEVPERFPDGLLHPTYTMMLTATGRLSSADVNIQNFPKRRHKELREQIIAPQGYDLFAFDYAQLEARVIAMASKDRNLCEKIISKYDIHSYWRDKCLEAYPDYIERLRIKTNETEEKKILKGGRNIIKTDFVFASFFGATTKSCAERTDIPLPIMTQIQGDFWREFNGVKKWIGARRNEFAEEGAIRTMTGMTRRGVLWGNEPINTPVQGTGAHIVIDAMNACAALSRELKDPALHPRINIHDDLSFFFPQSAHQEEYIELIAETLTAVRYPWQIVPFAIEAATGPSWAALEEFAVFEGDYIR